MLRSIISHWFPMVGNGQPDTAGSHYKDFLLKVGWVYPQNQKLIDPNTYKKVGLSQLAGATTRWIFFINRMTILSKKALTTHHHYCTALHIILCRAFEVQLDVAKTLRRTTSSPYWHLDQGFRQIWLNKKLFPQESRYVLRKGWYLKFYSEDGIGTLSISILFDPGWGLDS